MGNSEQRPHWVKDSTRSDCTCCNEQFGLVVRRHHCRKCGGVFCGDCCNRYAYVDSYNNFTPRCTVPSVSSKPSNTKRRVCKDCYSGIKGSNDDTKDEEEDFWLQAQEDLDAVRTALEHLQNSQLLEGLDMILTESTDPTLTDLRSKSASYQEIEKIQRSWGQISERHNNSTTGVGSFGSIYQDIINRLETNLNDKDKSGFTQALKQAKKKIVMDYEKVQGDEWFWELAVKDAETVRVALLDVSALLKQCDAQHQHSEDVYQILIEQVEGALEVQDKDAFLKSIKQAKSKITEDIETITSIEDNVVQPH